MRELYADNEDIRCLIVGMREAYFSGENAMAWARQHLGQADNNATAIEIAYDLQAGTYVDRARSNPIATQHWAIQLVGILSTYVASNCTMLEIGCGEATTLNAVVK